ncbi:MAG: hypothetical protein ACRDFQ_00055 [Anaerolineales bacterium]
MPRFLIEVAHENSKEACERAVQAFLATGSHFMTHADWGCPDDEHKAWIVAELDSKEDAMLMLPPAFRLNARVITLQNFAPDMIDDTLKLHKDS